VNGSDGGAPSNARRVIVVPSSSPASFRQDLDRFTLHVFVRARDPRRADSRSIVKGRRMIGCADRGLT
jgi:hypothetical protein